MATEPLKFPIFTPGARAARNAFRGIRGAIASAASSYLGLIAAAAGLTKIIGLTRQFEFQMTQVAAISGATKDEFNDLTNTARELGATTVFTATQAAEALTELARAGQDASTAIRTVPAVLLLARAGAIELGRSAEVIASLSNAFQLTASDAENVADVLVRTSQRSLTTVEGLARGFTFLGATANDLGLSLVESSAALGAIADQGVPVQRAGRGLSTLLSELSKETDAVDEAAKRVGLTARDLNPVFNDFGTVVSNLALVFRDAGVAQGTLSIISARTASLLANNADGYRNLVEETSNATGAAKQFSDQVSDNLDGSIKQLNSALSETLLQLGDNGLGKGTRDLVDILALLLNQANGTTVAFTGFSKVSEGVRDLMLNLGEQLAAVGNIILALAQSIGIIFQSVVDLKQGIDALARGEGLAGFKAAFAETGERADNLLVTFGKIADNFDNIGKASSGELAQEILFQQDAVRTLETSYNSLSEAVRTTVQVIGRDSRQFGQGQFEALRNTITSINKDFAELTRGFSEKITDNELATALKQAEEGFARITKIAGRPDLLQNFREQVQAAYGDIEELGNLGVNQKIIDEAQIKFVARLKDAFAGLNNETLKTSRRVQEVQSAFDRFLEIAEKIGTELLNVTQKLGDNFFDAFDANLEIQKATRETELIQNKTITNQRRLNELTNQLSNANDEKERRALQDRIDRLVTDNFDLQRQLIEAQFTVESTINGQNAAVASTLFDFATRIPRAGIFHDGGFVGKEGRNVPIIAQRGEAVFTPRQLDNAESLLRSNTGGGGGNVMIIDQRRADSNPPQVRRDNNGNIQVLLSDFINTQIRNGGFDDSLQARFGVRNR